MAKKLHDKVDNIPTDKEIDPDELVHEQEIMPGTNTNEEQDIDDLVHSVKQPEVKEEDEELDIDDLMHEQDNGGEGEGTSPGQ